MLHFAHLQIFKTVHLPRASIMLVIVGNVSNFTCRILFEAFTTKSKFVDIVEMFLPQKSRRINADSLLF